MNEDTAAMGQDVLGQIVFDNITGFQGTATGVCYNLDGTVQVRIEGVSKKGKLADMMWADSERVVLVVHVSDGEEIPAEQPVVEQPIADEQPVVEQPIADEQPVVEQPIADAPAAEAPVVEQPIADEQPVVEQPVADQTEQSA